MSGEIEKQVEEIVTEKAVEISSAHPFCGVVVKKREISSDCTKQRF